MTKEKAEKTETRLTCNATTCLHYLWADCGLKKIEIEDAICKQFKKKENQ